MYRCEVNHHSDDDINWLIRKKNSHNNIYTTRSHGDHRTIKYNLQSYSMGDVANCLNSIRKSHLSIDDDESTYTANITSLLRFVFIGDSRIRQQFFNFLKVLLMYIT